MGDSYQASHILVKHEGSRRKASWKDPEGKVIATRTRDEAVTILAGFIDRLLAACFSGEGAPQSAEAKGKETDLRG